MDDTFDVAVIGAGQAGLAVSRLLKASSVPHIVLERGEIGESWRSQRWDSFHLNTPSWSSGLPGLAFMPDAPDAFGHRDELVSYFERYVAGFDLPVREHAPVTRLERRRTAPRAVASHASRCAPASTSISPPVAFRPAPRSS